MIKTSDIATGFTQQIPGGFVFEIGNGWVNRRMHYVGSRLATTSLVNNLSAEEYLEETTSEFELTICGEGR